MAERPAPAALVLAVSLLLGACTAGVPRTGEVETIGPVRPPGDPVQRAGRPERPPEGLTEQEVVNGFMLAMSSGDPDAALPWVVDEPAARRTVTSWRAERINAYVYDQYPTLGRPGQEGDHTTIPVTARIQGRLEHGRYWVPEVRDRTIQLKLEQDKVEWRVANPPETPWLRMADFRVRWQRTLTFMVAPDGEHLTGVPIFVSSGNERSDIDVLRATVEALLEGPQGWVAGSLTTAIPPGTRLRDLSLQGNVAVVDLSAAFLGPGGPGRLRVGQLVWTITSRLPTASVEILVEGRPPPPVGPERFQAARQWQQTSPPLAGLQLARTGEPDSVLFVRSNTIWRKGEGQPTPAWDAVGEMSSPAWAPDGRRAAFLIQRGKQGNLVLYLGSAGERHPLATDLQGQLSAPTWAPTSGGSRVLVLRRARAGMQLWEVDPADRGLRQLDIPPLPDRRMPVLLRASPDGAYVLALGTEPGAAFGSSGDRLYLGLLGSDGVERWLPHSITPPAAFGKIYSPIWLDTTRIAFIAKPGTAQGDINELWTMDLDGWQPSKVDLRRGQGGSAVDFSIGEHLTSSPSGDVLIFTRRTERGHSLWRVRPEGGIEPLVEPVGEPNWNDTDPAFASR